MISIFIQVKKKKSAHSDPMLPIQLGKQMISL